MSEHLIRRVTSIKAVVLLAALFSISNCSPVGNPRDYEKTVTPNVNAGEKTEEPDRFKSRSDYTNPIGMQFMKIPTGSFMMGSPESDEKPVRERMLYATNNQPVHQVTINYSFYMGKYEVTQEQYQKLMGNNPSLANSNEYRCFDPKCPVDGVSWNAAKEFLRRLNTKDSSYKYRLPSEAEWEYSCRAGTATVFAFGDGLSSDKANFNGALPYGGAPRGPYLKKPVTIGSYRPNAWGLYDMHGNVGEWCEDFYHDNYNDAPTDGSANEKRGEQNARVERGGNWGNGATYLRSANRNAGGPGTGLSGRGLRIVGIPR